jgi:hypothetical protein
MKELVPASNTWDVENETRPINDHMKISNQDLDLFTHCWRLQSCNGCLTTTRPCSWCATSQTCVPNEVFSWPFSILAPIKTENVCPLGWKERWEMRSKPFSCRCSSMTFVSVVVAVLSTLVGVLLLWLLALFVQLLLRKWRKREDGWWRISYWSPRWTSSRAWQFRRGLNANTETTTSTGERTALLAA